MIQGKTFKRGEAYRTVYQDGDKAYVAEHKTSKAWFWGTYSAVENCHLEAGYTVVDGTFLTENGKLLKRLETFTSPTHLDPKTYITYYMHDGVLHEALYRIDERKTLLTQTHTKIYVDMVNICLAGGWKQTDEAYVSVEGNLMPLQKTRGTKKCDCPSRTLLLSGCQCGGI